MIDTQPDRKQERALLIGLEKEGISKWDLRDSLEELREQERPIHHKSTHRGLLGDCDYSQTRASRPVLGPRRRLREAPRFEIRVDRIGVERRAARSECGPKSRLRPRDPGEFSDRGYAGPPTKHEAICG